MYMDGSFTQIEKFDKEIADYTLLEEQRQLESLCLIASENYASPVTIGMEGTVWANKNAEGYPGCRFAGAVSWRIRSKIWPRSGAGSFSDASMSTFRA